MVLSINENGYDHLFAYQPQVLPLTRLTDHPWDDISPSLSPDGQRIAYSSRQNGYWNLYILDLVTGETKQVTDDPAYDDSPSWSPDSQWLAFSKFQNGTWEIDVLSMQDPTQPTLQLISGSHINYLPAWSPQGRMIAFVSDQTGEPEVWIADLDRVENRITDVSNSPSTIDLHPAWSPDGNELAWAAISNGFCTISIWNRNQPDVPIRRLGSGDWPTWSPDGTILMTRLVYPNQTFLTGYQAATGNVIYPPEAISGSLHGIDWKSGKLPDSLPENLAKVSQITPVVPWKQAQAVSPTGPTERHGIVLLGDVTAPYPYILDSVDASFQALRDEVADQTGWDFLSSLENAFVPLEDTLSPGLDADWLYTGRSIVVNSAPMNANWMVIVREDFGDLTYWRIYIRTRFQDGSQGTPISQFPWDLNARYSGNPQVYEQGGLQSTSVPGGYWLDFTDLAASYGWERLPSLIDWRTYFPAIRFNQFVLMDNLDWKSAMLDIYPPEILLTQTPALPASATPTRTPRWKPSETPTYAPSITPTFRPTWTPLPP
jgi:TolB protein